MLIVVKSLVLTVRIFIDGQLAVLVVLYVTVKVNNWQL
jgi:hypothetical protein